MVDFHLQYHDSLMSMLTYTPTGKHSCTIAAIKKQEHTFTLRSNGHGSSFSSSLPLLVSTVSRLTFIPSYSVFLMPATELFFIIIYFPPPPAADEMGSA